MFRHLVTLLLGLTLASGASLAADTITLSQSQLGNVFLSTETAQIPVQTTGDHVSWTATDFFGTPTAGAPIAVSGGKAVITPNLGRLGYFDLHVTAQRNGSTVASADTTFAILAPSNVSTMRDSAFGVQTHFAQGWNMDVMSLLARAGIAQIRDEQYWQNAEATRTKPATYSFSSYQSYMSALAAQHLNPLMILDFANTNYDSGNTPYTSDGLTGYANYTTALLGKYPSQIDTVEVWNEYNGSFCGGPATANRPQYYSAMLKAAYPALKALRPDVRVVGGACVPVPLPWYEDLFANGALDYLDALNAHPYVTIPEGLELDLAAVQSLMATYNHGNGPKPIWATECGASDPTSQGRQNMARYLVRIITLMRSAGVERVYWYLTRDYNSFTTGLLRSPNDPLGVYAPTSAFPAYSNLIQQLYGSAFVLRENTDPRTRMYMFHRSAGDVRVVWSTLDTAQLVLSATTPLTMVNIMGETSTLTPSNGLIALTVGTNPVYLLGAISGVREVGRDSLVADTVTGFSATQGTANGAWFYGNCVVSGTYNPSAPVAMTYTRNSFNYVYNSGYGYAQIDKNGGHPSSNGSSPVYTVRRWWSNSAATARFTGTAIRGATGGDGTGARIYVDGTLVYSTLVGASGLPGTINFDFNAPIKVGSKVDFVVTPGPGTDINYDYIDYRAQVSVPPPAPTTFAAWQAQNFTAADIADPSISGDNASPANDGVSNLAKYAANVSAKKFNPGILPRTSVQNVSSASYLALTYRRAPWITDLAFTTELNAGSLVSNPWVAGGVPFGTPVTNSDGTQTITIRDEVPIAPTSSRRFMRLRITRP